MTISRMNPEGLHATAGYSHVTLVTTPAVIVHLAGQMPLALDGSLVGRDPAGQVRQIVENALTALRAAQVGPENVVRSAVYVVSADPSTLDEVWTRLCASELAPAFSTASTLLGVTALGVPGQLVEVDLSAVRDQ